MRLHTLFLWVSDLDRSVSWYRELGLEADTRHGGWQPLVVDGDVAVALHEGAGPHVRATAVPAFAVDDLDDRIDTLSRAGIEPVDAVTDTGRARFVTYADPDGNLVQLLEER